MDADRARLSSQGLILLRPARTAVVAPLDLAELEEIYRLRELVEVDALGRAAPQLTSVDVETLERLTSRLQRVVTELWHAAERYIRIVYMETDVLFTHTPRERHEPLLAAARARDSEMLRAAMTAHLRSNHHEVAGSLKRILPPAPAN